MNPFLIFRRSKFKMRLLDLIDVQVFWQGHLVTISRQHEETHIHHQYEVYQVRGVVNVDNKCLELLIGKEREEYSCHDPEIETLTHFKRLNYSAEFCIVVRCVLQQFVGLRGAEQPVSVELGITPRWSFDQNARPASVILRFK